MKSFYSLLAFLLLFNLGFSQLNFSVSLTEKSINNMPALQSFVVGIDNEGRWLLIGGRTEGLHLRQPNASFSSNYNNTNIYVINYKSSEVFSTPLTNLPTSIAEQLQSTNMQSTQVNDKLYIVGGYAYSATAANHITFNKLTIVDVNFVTNAIVNGQAISPYFEQITNENMAVTGGYLHHLNNEFYLVGGQRFDGRYNPMGPTHGPGFSQNYTNEVRKFAVTGSFGNSIISNYSTFNDSTLMHKRDFNVGPMIFTSGELGFISYSGVFQIGQDIPYENLVKIVPTGMTEIPNFSQKLSHYHSANLHLYSANNNEFYNVFFGGIARYYFDAAKNLIDDQQVPFVKTISVVTRDATDTFHEMALDVEMPGLLGAGAEFIPVKQPFVD